MRMVPWNLRRSQVRVRARRRGAGVLVLALAGLVAAVSTSVATAGSAGAGGGDWVYPARDRYEAGQTVEMIGYGPLGADWREQGPFYAWLRVDPAAAEAADPFSGLVQPSDLRVAPVVIEELATPDRWRTHRASITFDLPSDLPPGNYQVVLCTDPCSAGPGNFWPEPVHVGVDPQHPVVRDWPLDEPMIRWLEDDALIWAPWGERVTAADVRAGRVQAPPPAPPEPDGAGTTADDQPGAAGPDDPAEVVSGGADATASRTGAGAGPAGGGAGAGTADGPAAASTGASDRGDRTPAWWIVGAMALLVGVLGGWRHRSRRHRRARGPVGDEHRSAATTTGSGAAPTDARDVPDSELEPVRVRAPDRESEPVGSGHRQSVRVRL